MKNNKILRTISVFLILAAFAGMSIASSCGSSSDDEDETEITSTEDTEETTTEETTTEETTEVSSEGTTDIDLNSIKDLSEIEDLVDPDLKAFYDSYCELLDNYCDFLERLSKADSKEQMNMMKEYNKFIDDLTKYETAALEYSDNEEELSEIDAFYMLKKTAEIEKRLIEMSFSIGG